jgi:5'(3')-deoxyribonucleotidase
MLKLFLDLDGTLAKFNSKKNALKRFDNEKGFFSSLKPYKNIEVINELATCGNVEVYVISATPNEQADQDKMIWIKTYLKQIKQENICFCRLNENKAKVIKDKLNIEIDKECILLDDYTKNLIEWKNLNGIGIKRLTSKADNSRKIWKDYSIRNLIQLEKTLSQIAIDNA